MPSVKFNIGDIVEALGSREGRPKLVTGKTYVVTQLGHRGDMLYLDGSDSAWATCHFKLAFRKCNASAWEVGDSVEDSPCVLFYKGCEYRILTKPTAKDIEIEEVRKEMDKLSERLAEIQKG